MARGSAEAAAAARKDWAAHLKPLVDAAGGPAAVARKLAPVSRQAIQQWTEGGTGMGPEYWGAMAAAVLPAGADWRGIFPPDPPAGPVGFAPQKKERSS